ncbi:GNAT family N-acetyltransferase [Homoserinibacter sp. YIM 151385]|uniref:GNAT family N-acetyltransferase n=1 Tax=Homoserinibacter sp. YIM 151385 TaxID=2985506 RepID=UPI0022F0D415|nr:GNAT family N-acetyltransferase [Homoserinibacter sp. YIM 151385]WBU37065.1 GNAT family N-acetyltransferase [Homoserinibacter sp. YIM 151385]
MTVDIRRAPAAELDPVTLYRILELRVQVFIVEQAAAYPDLDGRDIEPGAELLWAEEDGRVLATVRVLHEGDAMRIGRVATALEARSRGVASTLMRAAVERCEELAPASPIELGAQAHLADWYGRFGFRPTGELYEEDGIPHTGMRRPGLG